VTDIELAMQFGPEAERLVGVLHSPERPASVGVVFVVGGPQYRVGSHRQFVLLARTLAAEGFAVLRFDYAGMGDSDGDERSFERIDDQMRLAVDELAARVHGLERFVLFGLCDAASASLMYAPRDPRITGLVLINPWARGEQTLAKTHLRHYYWSRLTSSAFWSDLVKGRVAIGKALGGVVETSRTALSDSAMGTGDAARPDFRERMLESLQQLRARVLLIVSGRDLTAAEFLDMIQASRAWRAAMSRADLVRHDLPEADHTFSTRRWRDEVGRATVAWLRKP